MCQQKRPEPKIVKPRAENPRLTVQEVLDILIRFYLYQRGLNCACENCRRARNWRPDFQSKQQLEGPDFQSKQFVTNQLSLQDKLIKFTTIYLLDYFQCIRDYGATTS